MTLPVYRFYIFTPAFQDTCITCSLRLLEMNFSCINKLGNECLGLVSTWESSFLYTEKQATLKFKTQATDSEMYVCKLSDFMSASDVPWIQITSFGVGGAGRKKPKNDLQNKSLIRMRIIECNPISSLSAFLWWLQMSPFSPAMWGNNLDKITLFVCEGLSDASSWQLSE